MIRTAALILFALLVFPSHASDDENAHTLSLKRLNIDDTFTIATDGVDHTIYLPKDILKLVLTYCDHKDLPAIRDTCRNWRAAAQDLGKCFLLFTRKAIEEYLNTVRRMDRFGLYLPMTDYPAAERLMHQLAARNSLIKFFVLPCSEDINEEGFKVILSVTDNLCLTCQNHSDVLFFLPQHIEKATIHFSYQIWNKNDLFSRSVPRNNPNTQNLRHLHISSHHYHLDEQHWAYISKLPLLECLFLECRFAIPSWADDHFNHTDENPKFSKLKQFSIDYSEQVYHFGPQTAVNIILSRLSHIPSLERLQLVSLYIRELPSLLTYPALKKVQIRYIHDHTIQDASQISPRTFELDMEEYIPPREGPKEYGRGDL